MLQDEVTKNVFREMDGFLVLMSVLSTIQDHHHAQDDHTAAIETTRLVFVVLAEATTDHLENSDFFRVCKFYVPIHYTNALHRTA
jgi:hypothetical protein